MSRILIVGCGYVGITLGLRLVRSGHDVFGARRNPDNLPPEIRPVRADVTASAGLEDIPPNLDHVFCMATAGRSDDAAYERVYVDGLGNVIRALRRSTVERLCFVSSTVVYGQRDGSMVDEKSPTAPSGFRGVRMLEAEQLVLQSPFEGIIARSAGIYGPGRTRLIDRIRAGEQPVHNTATFTNRIHRDDLAAALEHLIRIDRPDPVYICADNEPAAASDVVAWIAHALGVPVPTSSTAPAPSSDRIRTNKRCSNARLRGTGFECQYSSYREGYGELIGSLRASP